MRKSIFYPRVTSEADIQSDHYIVRSRIRLKLTRLEEIENSMVMFNVRKLIRDEMSRRCNQGVKNSFEYLRDIEHQEEEHDQIWEIKTAE